MYGTVGIVAAMYLRKSRAEEGMDTAEILRRHRETLNEFAARNGIRVREVFQEVKSGGSLYARPEMIRLLEAVEAGRYQAVLCMDIDRLSRGETWERGQIWATFKRAGTLIVTPGKTYNFSEESDELMVELRGLFANYEYKKIRERQQRGIARAVQEGQFLAPTPYGYRKRVIDHRHTLEIYEPEARFVRMMFDLYRSGVGSDAIAARLNEAGARPRRAEVFSKTAVFNILRNPVYAGKIVWNQTQWTDGKRRKQALPRPESEWTVTDGIHPPIISQELFDECKAIRKARWRPACFDGTIKSPLAGLVRCKRCGKYMQRQQNSGYYYLRCSRRRCSTLANYADVERAVIEGLRDILCALEMEPGQQPADALAKAQARLASARNSIAAEKRKQARLYDFLESGTYSEAVFRERMDAANGRMAALKSREKEALQEMERLSAQDKRKQADGIHALLQVYESADGAGRNALLQGVVDVIWYERNGREPFALEIFLK
ncbi:MAG: recombinase family protein [Oscillibacter sp.]|nr:recombinase family protein [Oscillibacter sp.]